MVIPPNLPSVYVNQWNLSIQKQVGTWLATANYMGSEATALKLSSVEGNPAVYLPESTVA